MKRWAKGVLTFAIIILISVCVVFIMSIVKDWFLKASLNNGKASDKSIVDKTPVTLRFSWWGEQARNAATIQAIKIFNEKYPWIEVIPEYQGYGEYHDKIMVQLSASSAPDIFQFNPENMGSLVLRNYVEDLSSFVRAGKLDISNIAESSLLDGKCNGILYGIPMSIQTFCVMYNKSLFDYAKVAYPTNNWTWEDFESIINKLKEKLPHDIYPSADMRSGDLVTMLMVHQKKGFYLAKDKTMNFKKQIAWPLKLFQGYMEKGLISPLEETSANSIDGLFVSAKVAMIQSYNAMAQTLQAAAADDQKYGMVAIPSSTTGEKLGSYVKGELLFVLNSKSDKKEEAVKLLNEFVNNEQIGEKLSLVRGIPPNNKIRNNLMNKATGLDKEIFVVQQLAEQSNDKPEMQYINGWSSFIGIVDEETQNYAFGIKSLDEAINSMEQRFEKVLEDSK